MKVSPVALRLREIRTETGMSIRAVADALDVPKGRYEHYEARYKKAYLPADLAMKLADIFAKKSVPREDVMALAAPTELDVAADDLQLGQRYSSLSARRQRMMREFLEELEAAEAAGRGSQTPGDDGPLEDDKPAT